MRRLLAPALLALAACNTGFQPQYLVTDLRILAVRAEVVGTGFADADVGDTLRLTALVVNPQARPGLAAVWRACVPQPGQLISPCLDPAVLRDASTLDGKPGVIRLDQVGTPSPDGRSIDVPLTGALGTAVGQAFDALVAQATPANACSLFLELPVVVQVDVAGRREVALKNVRLTPASRETSPPLDLYVRNVNPVIATLEADPSDEADCFGGVILLEPCPSGACGTGATCTAGADGTAAQCLPAPGDLPGGTRVMCAGQEGAPQQFDQCSESSGGTATGGVLEEKQNWQWYATAGSFPDAMGVGNVTDDHPKFERPPGAFTLWVVLRDGRGGEGWIRRDFAALAP